MEAKGKRSQENGPKEEKDKTERVTGLGRRTRGDINYTENGIKLVTLRFQTGGRHQQFPASLRGSLEVIFSFIMLVAGYKHN